MKQTCMNQACMKRACMNLDQTELERQPSRLLEEVDRRNTNCLKWDELGKRFGDPDLIAMWVADMDFKAPRPVLDAMHARVEHGAFGYLMPSPEWKNAFIHWEMTRYGYRVEPEWIRYTPGVVPAVYWLVNALTEPGDACIILTPVYYPFHHAIRDTGRSLICCDLVNERGSYHMDFEKFEQDIILNRVKLFILCSPHNPVGRVWSREELERLRAICDLHGVTILSDEIHQDIVTGERRHTPTGLVAGDARNLITLTSASKTFNLASLENSLLVIQDAEIREKYDAFVRKYHPGGGNALGFVAVEAAYRHGEQWLEELLAEIRGNEVLIRESFAISLPEAVISPLEGTYLLWIDLRALLPETAPTDFMVKSCGVAVDYGSWFGESGKGFIRLNLATPRHRVEEVTERILAAADTLRKETNMP